MRSAGRGKSVKTILTLTSSSGGCGRRSEGQCRPRLPEDRPDPSDCSRSATRPEKLFIRNYTRIEKESGDEYYCTKSFKKGNGSSPGVGSPLWPSLEHDGSG